MADNPFSATQLDDPLDTPLDDSMILGEPAPREPSLGETSQDMKQALAGYISARAELAGIEAKEAAQFTVSKVVQGVILALCALLAWLLILAALTGMLAGYADKLLDGKIPWLPGWAAVLLALALLHSMIAVIFSFLLKKKPGSPLFELTREEIVKDKQWLQKNK